jgi:CRISPR-associated endonuclease/helicase Cas3
MGAALATSAQLEAFRRRSGWRRPGLARSLWVSATLDPAWLDTAEFRTEIPAPIVLRWNDGAAPEPAALAMRMDAVKHLRRAETVLNAGAMKKPDSYARELAREVAAAHRQGTTTLVIVNTVARAQALHAALDGNAGHVAERLLIHSRYRPRERRDLVERLRTRPDMDRIVVATQAVEAGVNVTSAVLFTELAPWSSLVQRFGRCNRTGECTAAGGAEIRWIDADTEADASAAHPYEPEALRAAREVLAGLVEASPRNLPPPSPPPPPVQVIRPRDFEELFDTDPDLSGYDLDISPYIRDGDDVPVGLFWRSVGAEPLMEMPPPNREELCPAPLGAVRTWLDARLPASSQPAASPPPSVFIEAPNSRGKGWEQLDRKRLRLLRPGMTLLLDAGVGGYDPRRGFDPAVAAPVAPVPMPATASADDEMAPGTRTDDDHRSRADRPVQLRDHLRHVRDAAVGMADVLDLPDDGRLVLERAAAWHDVGKAHDEFQRRLGNAERANGDLAKNVTYTRHGSARPWFRHELASALAFLAGHDGEPDGDLVAFLIAAHHGKVRMALRALPDERPEDPSVRMARGVQDGDRLPEVRCGDEVSAPLTLDLELMELGEDEAGRPSWSARTQALLATHGPFRLAYLEALLRIADWRASAVEQAAVAKDA